MREGKDCTSDLCTCVSVDLKSCGLWYLWAGPPREPGANLSSCLSFPSVSGPIGIPSFGEVGYLINLWAWCLSWIFFSFFFWLFPLSLLFLLIFWDWTLIWLSASFLCFPLGINWVIFVHEMVKYTESREEKSVRENMPAASAGILAGCSWVFHGKHLDTQNKV